MMDEECLLTDGISPIDHVLNHHIVHIEETRKEKHESRDVVGDQGFVHILVEEPHHTGDEERYDEEDVEVNPEDV